MLWIIWVDRRYLWLVGSIQSHPLTNHCLYFSLNLSQKSLRRKLVPILPVVYFVAKWHTFQRLGLHCVRSAIVNEFQKIVWPLLRKAGFTTPITSSLRLSYLTVIQSWNLFVVLAFFSETVKIRQAQVDKLYEGLKDLAEERRGKLDETLKLYQLQGEIDDLEQWIAEKEVVAGSQDIGQDLAQVEVHFSV